MPTPNIKEIEWAISELEQDESSKSNYILLAALYTCRENMQGSGTMLHRDGYSAASAPEEELDLYGESDFLRAVAGISPAAAWHVMDGLMDTLRVVNLKVYESVMRKIQRL